MPRRLVSTSGNSGILFSNKNGWMLYLTAFSDEVQGNYCSACSSACHRRAKLPPAPTVASF
ncbi:hypothetical protein HMPREF1569_0326 [Klebsiella oxytoca OK-1]|nr:hypothetical protein HMPREF1569_0326 [Klebsiella oxytoca OK-1]